MTTEIVEGEAVELPERSLVPVQPGQVIVTEERAAGPVDMLARASVIATALQEMVEQQKLFTLINSKKYPHVEAWMTIGRMDNVVAREAHPPVRNDDGSWEAEVELVRLSDGLVIGRASALCGGPGDFAGKNDWTKRADHHKRSMAVTRATSRAFRLQYSWIMALAGYEPTPADEMPHEAQERPVAPTPEPSGLDGLVGTVTRGKRPVDMDLRYEPDGTPAVGFKLAQGRSGIQVLAKGSLAEILCEDLPRIEGQTVTVWGHVEFIDWMQGDKPMPPYRRLALERIKTSEFVLPADVPAEAASVGMFTEDPLTDEEKAAIAGGLS